MTAATTSCPPPPLLLIPKPHGALPPAPPDAISGPLLAADEVEPGAGDRLLLLLVCEMIRARSSCFLLLLVWIFFLGRGFFALRWLGGLFFSVISFFRLSLFPARESIRCLSLCLSSTAARKRSHISRNVKYRSRRTTKTASEKEEKAA